MKGSEEKKVKGWSTEDMKDKAKDQCWKKLAERMKVEVLDMYKVQDSKREAEDLR